MTEHTSKQLQKFRVIKDFIKSQGSRFVTVYFIKKDGEERSITFNPQGSKKHVKGSKSDNVVNRKKNNPHLINVWEHNNKDEETKFRSINLDTVFKVSAGNMTLEV